MFREILISDQLFNNASRLYDFNCRNSFTQMGSSIYGAIGELVVSRQYGEPLCNTKDYDLFIQGSPFDVKTKRCTSPPKSHYWVSVAELSLHQKCDYYIFVRVHESLSKAWILGYTSKDVILSLGAYRVAGERDPHGFKIVSNCYNLKISQLWKG